MDLVKLDSWSEKISYKIAAFSGATRTTYTFGSKILSVCANHNGGGQQALNVHINGNSFSLKDFWSTSIGATIIVVYE